MSPMTAAKWERLMRVYDAMAGSREGSRVHHPEFCVSREQGATLVYIPDVLPAGATVLDMMAMPQIPRRSSAEGE